MYLGDIVRRVLLKMAEEAEFFGDTVPPKLKIPFIIRYDNLSIQKFTNFLELDLLSLHLVLTYKFLYLYLANNDSETLSSY